MTPASTRHKPASNEEIMNITVESVIDKAEQFRDSSRIWGRVDKDRAKITDAPGKDLFSEGIVIAKGEQADECFAFAERIAGQKDIVHAGPIGIYSIRHLCAAIWYKAQNRIEDYERLLRIVDMDLEDRLQWLSRTTR